MVDKRKRCLECGQKILAEVKVPDGYMWERGDNYSWGHWVKKQKEKRHVKIKKEEC